MITEMGNYVHIHILWIAYCIIIGLVYTKYMKDSLHSLYYRVGILVQYVCCITYVYS